MIKFLPPDVTPVLVDFFGELGETTKNAVTVCFNFAGAPRLNFYCLLQMCFISQEKAVKHEEPNVGDRFIGATSDMFFFRSGNDVLSLNVKDNTYLLLHHDTQVEGLRLVEGGDRPCVYLGDALPEERMWYHPTFSNYSFVMDTCPTNPEWKPTRARGH